MPIHILQWEKGESQGFRGMKNGYSLRREQNVASLDLAKLTMESAIQRKSAHTGRQQ